MSNIDPFNPMPRTGQDPYDTRYGNQGGGAIWPIVAVIVLLLAAGFVVGI